MRAEKRIIMDNLVITVARGFGSCGKRIAKQIADDLGEQNTYARLSDERT